MSRNPRTGPYRQTLGPFIGQRDRTDPRVPNEHYASAMVNVWPRPGDFTCLVRPGFERNGVPAASVEGQGVFHLSLPGSETTYVVAGGKLYEANSTLATFTDRTPAGITINTTGRVYMVYFAQKIIVSDGANKPWAYDPSDHTGTILSKTAGAWYGPPVVYYAKLFGIVADDRRTIEWSEEESPTTGYDDSANNFDNSWTLAQSDQEALTVLCASNEALYYFRENSIGAVLGAVNSDFKTAGVHDGVSTEIGTSSPDSVHLVGQKYLYFVDATGKPQRIEYGGTHTEIWQDCAETIADVVVGSLADVWSARLEAYNAVAFAMPIRSGETTLLDLLVFDEPSGRCLGTWNYLDTATAGVFQCGCAGRDSTGAARFLFLDADGRVHRTKLESDSDVALDEQSGTDTLPDAHVAGPMTGYGTETELLLDRIAVVAERTEATHGPKVAIDYKASRTDFGTAQDVALASGDAGTEVRGEVGTSGRGRWVIPRVSNADEANSVRHGWREMTVTGTRIPAEPTTP